MIRRLLPGFLGRWLAPPVALPAWPAFVAWARAQGWVLKRAQSHDGWVMEQQRALPGWRIEWGPAQRAFMGSHEFRIRIDLPAAPDVAVMILDRPLLQRIDHALWQQFTQGNQTRFDDSAPEEMRWLALHEKLGPELGLLRERYGGVADDPDVAARWLQAGLSDALQRLSRDILPEQASVQPMLLRLTRGQLMLRQAAERPDPILLERCIGVAKAAQAACPIGPIVSAGPPIDPTDLR